MAVAICVLERKASMKRLLGFSVLVLTAVSATSVKATTDEIRVGRGPPVQPLNRDGDINVEGTSGLRIDATLEVSVAIQAWASCELHPCQPGDVVSLRTGYGAHPAVFTGSGQVTLRGQTYSLWDDATADLLFDGT